ncbi:helix-turn-helix transcriptional regulator [Clostridium manihotivorum]|uniref:Uncharacterized protein n=1 Tax=Clostridium manihotivorum TaxID=2320868 RepID=A0A3R5QS52_9CLOT|nr:helix-turn-helix transcriptional regulator [Clostridium manihotivorum]QAA31213.1 hypothetical protein C1I91_05900 [Clostridium manihotivorum]
MRTNEILKMIRNDLDITQDDLVCEKISRTVISKLERGKKEISPIQAIKLRDKILNIQKEKNIALDYEVSTNFLLGITHFDIEKILSDLEKKVDRLSLNALDEALRQMVDSDFISLCTKAIHVFKSDLYANSDLIILYAQEVLKRDISISIIIDMNIMLIRAYYAKGEFKTIIHLAETHKKDIEQCCDKEIQISFYFNLATAYYKERKYNDALNYIEIIKKLKLRKYEEKVLTLEANIETKLKNYDSAKKVYFKIIRISKDNTIIANSYGNIASLYHEQKKYRQAREYLNRAYEFIREVSTQCKYNILYNKLELDIDTNQKNDVYIDFTMLLEVFSNMNSEINQNTVFEKVIDYFENEKLEVFKIINNIKQYNLKISDRLLLKVILKFTNDTEMIKLIS